MQRTQIYLPKNHIRTLRKEALQQQSTLSQMIRDLIRERLDDRPSTSQRDRSPNLFSAAKRINAMGLRAPKDLASKLDSYLYE
jgi:hypothetical protein